MSATIPFVALAMLIGLSLGARPTAQFAARAGRQYASATLAIGLLMSFWIFS